jgi:hypothetical protein
LRVDRGYRERSNRDRDRETERERKRTFIYSFEIYIYIYIAEKIYPPAVTETTGTVSIVAAKVTKTVEDMELMVSALPRLDRVVSPSCPEVFWPQQRTLALPNTAHTWLKWALMRIAR